MFRLTDGLKPISVAIKASKLECRPTFDRLQELFRQGQERKLDQKPKLLNTLRKQLSGYTSLTEADFYNTLRSAGVQVVERDGTYLYVDHHRGGVWHETELGRAWQYDQLSRRFGTTSEKVHAAISQEAGKELGRRVSLLFGQYQEQSGKAESRFIEEFPFTDLVQGLRHEGVVLEHAVLTVRQFEVYKQSQLPQIRAKELLSSHLITSELPRPIELPDTKESQKVEETTINQRLR